MFLGEAILKSLRRQPQKPKPLKLPGNLQNIPKVTSKKGNPKSIIASPKKVNLHPPEYDVLLLKSAHRVRITYMKYTHLELKLPKNWHNIVTFHIV